MVPNYRSPFKTDTITHVQDRLEMCRIGVKGFPHCIVWDWEANRTQPSYTIESVGAVNRQFMNPEIVLILGSDTARDIRKWHRFPELIKLVSIAVIQRESEPQPVLTEFQDKVTPILMTPVDISSTEIRTRIHNNQTITGLVSPELEEYIQQKGLYR